MDIHEIRNEEIYDEFMDTFQAVLHLILCDECRNLSRLGLQSRTMDKGRFYCGKPAKIPNHLEMCIEFDCELCDEFLQHSDVNLTVQDICNRMVRFMENHTGSAATLVVPINRSSFGPPELAANFKSVAEEEIIPVFWADPSALDNETKKNIKGYDTLRSEIICILHSAFCVTCRQYIKQGSEMLRNGLLSCHKKMAFPNHLAECFDRYDCAICEIAEHCSEEIVDTFDICNGLIRFVEIYAGVPPEKRLKAPPGRLFVPNTAAVFKTAERIDQFDTLSATEAPCGTVVDAEVAANQKSSIDLEPTGTLPNWVQSPKPMSGQPSF